MSVGTINVNGVSIITEDGEIYAAKNATECCLLKNYRMLNESGQTELYLTSINLKRGEYPIWKEDLPPAAAPCERSQVPEQPPQQPQAGKTAKKPTRRTNTHQARYFAMEWE